MTFMQHTVNMVQVVEYLTGKGVSKQEALEVRLSSAHFYTLPCINTCSSSVNWTEMAKDKLISPTY